MEYLRKEDFIEQMVKGKVSNFSNKKLLILPLPNDTENIKKFTKRVANQVLIFDGIKEHPYMLGKKASQAKRNEEVFKTAIELRLYVDKTLEEIAKEVGVKLKKSKCKISEGGGWYSEGLRYSFNNYYTEI